jgi:hypothetical protein
MHWKTLWIPSSPTHSQITNRLGFILEPIFCLLNRRTLWQDVYTRIFGVLLLIIYPSLVIVALVCINILRPISAKYSIACIVCIYFLSQYVAYDIVFI